MTKVNDAVVVDLFLLILFSILFIIGLSYDYEARLLPLVVSVPGLIFTATQVVSDLIKNKRKQTLQKSLTESNAENGSDALQLADGKKEKIPLKNHFMAIGWVISFFLSVLLFGFHITIVAFVIIFSRIYTRKKWLFCLIITAICWTSVYIIFNRALGVILYDGVFVEYMKDIFH
jgi:hypothetical protein